MKHLKISLTAFCVVICIFLTAAACGSQAGRNTFKGMEAVDIQGNTVTDEVFKNTELTMVNIWGTFCGPCLKEMPDLAELADEYDGRMQIIGMVIDVGYKDGKVIPENAAETMAQIIEQTGADYLHLLTTESLSELYLSKANTVPETLFVDSTGAILGKSYIGSKDKAEWKAVIEEKLKEVESGK